MKSNTNITYKEFKETNIFKSASIIEFVNSKGMPFEDISDKTLENMIVKDYNYENGYLSIVLRKEEMTKMEIMLFNAIILLFDENITEYKGIDDEEFINKVCSEIGMTEDEYKKLMLLNN